MSGADNPRGQNFYVNRNLLSLWSFATCFKKFSLKSDFIYYFHDFIHVYSPGTAPDNIIMSVNRNILSLWSFVASLINISLKSDFIQFFS